MDKNRREIDKELHLNEQRKYENNVQSKRTKNINQL